MASRIIAIGDIHGCSRALDVLLTQVQPQPGELVIPLGDYVDRGPDSRGVLDRLVQLGRCCQLRPLLGNHDKMMLEVVKEESEPHQWIRFGATETLDSYGFGGDLSVIPADHIQFLEDCLPYIETERHFFVHANYVASLPLEEQDDRHLRWKTLREGIPEPHCSGKKAVVGHSADEGGDILDLGHLVCLDTCCYGGGWLTAMDVVSGQAWQANQQGNFRKLN